MIPIEKVRNYKEVKNKTGNDTQEWRTDAIPTLISLKKHFWKGKKN